MMPLTRTQIGLLRDIRANRVTLDDATDWLRDRLVELIFHEAGMLIDTQGPSVFLTERGQRELTAALDGPAGSDSSAPGSEPHVGSQ